MRIRGILIKEFLAFIGTVLFLILLAWRIITDLYDLYPISTSSILLALVGGWLYILAKRPILNRLPDDYI